MTALARFRSPVGTLSVEATDDGVCSVRFGGRDGARPPISKRTRHNLEAGLQALADYFSGHPPLVPTLDLHGFTTDAVADAVDRFLMKSQRAGHRKIRLITGKGTGAVRKTALDWLKLGGFPYSAENEGSFVIFLED